MNRKNKIVVCLCLLVFMLSISSLSTLNYTNFSNDTNTTLETSATNYLFNSKNYTFNLDDFYDDAILNKTFTGAKFQTNWFNDTEMAWSETIDNDTVIPVNNTNTKSPDLGHYPATYSFENDIDGSVPNEWTKTGTGTLEVQASKEGHDKVIYLLSGAPLTAVYANQYFDTGHHTGIVELWWYPGYGDGWANQLHFYNPVDIGYFFVSGDDIYWYDFTDSILIASNIMNQWNHLKISFDGINVSVSVNQETPISVIFRATYDTPNRIALFSYDEKDCWFDAIGYSWDPEYTPSEHHAGTYSFTNDANGSNPAGWSIQEGATYTLQVIDSLDDHKKVVEMYDNETTTRVRMSRSVSAQTILDIEFYYRSNDTTKTFDFLVADGTYNNFYMHTLPGLTVDTWHHVRYSINTITDTFCSWIDENADDVDVALTRNMDAITTILWETNNAQEDYYVYLDAIGGLWDSYYTIGDNLLPSTGNIMPVGLNIINGTFDNTDNMEINDNNYSNFTSVGSGGGTVYLDPDGDVVTQWLPTPGPVHYTGLDDAIRQPAVPGTGDRIAATDGYENKVDQFTFENNTVGVVASITLWHYGRASSGEDPRNKVYIGGGWTGLAQCGFTTGNTWKSRVLVGAWSQADIDALQVYYLADSAYGEYDSSYIYAVYFEVPYTNPTEVNFTADLNFDEVDTSKLLAVSVSSHHYTNISITITGNIYNYTSNSYVQMFSSATTSELKRFFMNDTVPTDFLNSNGDLRLSFTGTGASFNLTIDLINITFYYKLDLEHSKAFDTNGVYRYRWEIIGSIHYTQWVTFEVVDPTPNFHAVSESYDTTRWRLQGAEISPVANFSDDISGANWDLYGVSERIIHTDKIIEEDTYVYSGTPDSNHGSSTAFLTAYYQGTGFESRSLIKWEYAYLDANYTANSSLYYRASVGTNENITVYHTDNFYEATATWNNQPSAGAYQGTFLDPWGWQEDGIGAPNYYYMFKTPTDMERYSGIYSKESVNKPQIRHHISKNYLGGGYMYMQTNTTELISLQSTIYGTNYTLSSGDYFEVDFQTSSDSQISLILLKDDVVNKTLILSDSGNSNFNRHTAQISVDETVEFDQIKISSTFEDTDNVRIYDIKTYKYTLTGDSVDFLIGPKNDYSVYLTPDIYNLRIFDPYDGDVKVNENITIPATGVKHYNYEPTESIQCRITLFTVGKTEYLQFEDYHITINRSLNGEYHDFELVDTLFYADKDTVVYINVTDRFDNLITIDNPNPISASYLDLELEVYSLQIKNLMEQRTTLDINSSYTYPLLSGDSLYFMLSEAYYEIGYYNPNNVYTQFLILLNSNQAYELNMSRICNLYYTNQRMEPLNFYRFKTYINGTRIINNVFYATDGEHKGIEVKDLSDISVLNYTYVEGTEEYNQIPLILTQYSLKVMSLQLCFNHINITRDPDHYGSTSYYWSEWLAPRDTAEYFLFAGYYKINITNNEDETSTYYSYTLNGDDYILIGSNNTIYNVLVNLANVNATIGNQITEVYIDITNQNSNINNSVVSIYINLNNINSTLGSLLFDMNTAISNINSSIISEIVSLSTEITNINSSISNQILTISTDLTNINSSIMSQILTLGVDISNINGSIINQILTLGVDITNINTSLSNQMLSIGVDISNLDTSITNQIVSVISNITNINTTLSTQITSLSSDIVNINASIVNQIVSLGVDITNINTSLSNQILSLEVDISNLDSSITDQILLVIADIENIETVIDDQTLVILSDITNVNSTLLNQMAVLGVDITNINATITNQILSLSVDLTNINSSISNLLTNIDISITTLQSEIGTFFAFTNTSFINLNNVMNTSFINIENNIFTINTSISNLVIGVSNDIYLINGTISTMITQMENNLLLMNVSINTALFDLGTTLNLIGSNITSNFILLNNSINLTNLNVNDSRIAIINNLVLINNTISNLISQVYSSVYMINNSIYTAVVDLGTYLNIVNNTISGNLSIVLQMNEFLTEIYQMTMFSELLNWTNIGINSTLLESQIDVWEFINNYRDDSITVYLKYGDLIDNLTISAQNSIEQYLPKEDVEYRLWSIAIEEYLTPWVPLPENRTVSFGFYEAEIPYDPEPLQMTFFTYIVAILFFVGLSLGALKLYYSARNRKNPIPPELLRYMNKKPKRKIQGAVNDQL